MIPRIVTLAEKKLIGQRLAMSLANYQVGELWRRFLPRRREIAHPLSTDLLALTVYSPTHFTDFKPTNQFEKWAAVEVAHFDHVPAGLETLVLPAGLYAVFDYVGLSTDQSVHQFIFGTWLPASGYTLANRPHFEVLGEKYKNNDPTSEEEIWIPVAAGR
jgi:AraC family transcriptional regulator